MAGSRQRALLRTILFAAAALPGDGSDGGRRAGLAPDGIELEVSPGGPLASLVAARDEVRRLRAAGRRGPVTVRVADGRYALAEPFVLEPEDGGTAGAPVRYLAAGGARPVFSGGAELGGFEAGADGLWRLRPPEGTPRFDQLFVGGRRATPARTPDAGCFRMRGVREEVHEQGAGRAPARASQHVAVTDEVLALLAGQSAPQLARVQLVVLHKWDVTRRFLAAVERERGELVVAGRGMKPWNSWREGTRFTLEGLPAAVTAPGEWRRGADGVVVYRPREDEAAAGPEAARAVAPRLDHLVVVAGRPEEGAFVEHVTLEGLAFRHGAYRMPPGGFEAAQAAAPIDAAVQIDGARDVRLQDCEVAHVGRYGVWFRRGCTDCRLEQSVLRDLGAGGVRIGEGEVRLDERERTGAVTVADCVVHAGGRIFPCAVGVWIGQSGGNRILRSEVSDFFYTGVSVGWRWGYGESLATDNHVVGNHLHHLGQGLLSDLAGVYTLGVSPGTRIAENWVHDVRTATYGGWGLYTDEGSTGIVLERNLVHDTDSGAFHQHYGRENVVRNNVLAFARDQLLQATRVEEHRSFTFERNVCLLGDEPLLAGPWATIEVAMDGNVYWRLGGGPVRFGELDLEAWREIGRDAGSVVADPGFVDPAARDFRPRDPDAAPLAAVGFEPFDLAAGPRAPSRWGR